jgi:hypothetical protein
MPDPSSIESILNEHRLFQPPADFAAAAHVKSFGEYEQLYAEAAADPEAFWARQAETLHWFKRWDTVLEWNEPFAEWFVGGKINIAYNCLDRHLTSARRNKAAFIWEGEPGEIRTLTYQLGRRAGRDPYSHLPAASSRGLQIRERLKETECRQGRPCGTVYAARA